MELHDVRPGSFGISPISEKNARASPKGYKMSVTNTSKVPGEQDPAGLELNASSYSNANCGAAGGDSSNIESTKERAGKGPSEILGLPFEQAPDAQKCACAVEGFKLCKYCQCFRPPRAHHCEDCGRCVLRRDHHCSFLGSCIGFYNHKYYILLLYYFSGLLAVTGTDMGHFMAFHWRVSSPFFIPVDDRTVQPISCIRGADSPGAAGDVGPRADTHNLSLQEHDLAGDEEGLGKRKSSTIIRR